jgi:small-conductance mechanosensitive channel
VLGLGVSLASAGLVNQWVSGIVILYSRSFRPGDYVKMGDIEGMVTDLGPLATKIRTIRREEVTIPNAVVTAEKLTNYTRLGAEQGALLSIPLSIGYDVPWRRVNALLEQAAANTAGVRSDPRPCVLQWELTDFYVEHRLHVHLERAEERITVRSALNSTILDTFAAAGVQIMSPHYESQPERPVIASMVPS